MSDCIGDEEDLVARATSLRTPDILRPVLRVPTRRAPVLELLRVVFAPALLLAGDLLALVLDVPDAMRLLDLLAALFLVVRVAIVTSVS
jgi:hypothetical protein